MNNIQPSGRPKTGFVVLLLTMVAALTFGAVLWSARGPSVPQRVEAFDQAKQQRDEWNQQRDALNEAVKNLQASQQKFAGEMDELKRQISREGGERKLLLEQIGSLSARVDGLSAVNANNAAEAVTPQKKRR